MTDTPNFYEPETLPLVKTPKPDKARSNYLSLVEVKSLPEFQRLTPKQKLFVLTYCEGGLLDGNYDAAAATMTAYHCKTEENARIMSYAQMGNIRIIAVLNRYFNVSPTEEFMDTLDRAIRNKNLSIAQMEALRLKSILLGYKNVPAAARHVAVPPDVAKESKVRRGKDRKPRKPRRGAPLSDMEKDMANVRF